MREVRLGDGFAEGTLEVDLGHRPIHDLLANLAYGREVESTLREAVCFIEQRNLRIEFGSTNHNLNFLLWMDRQAAFSREWYFGQIYWRYMSMVAAVTAFSESKEPPADALMTLAYETMGLGALCREYELSRDHRSAVLQRAKQISGFGSADARMQRNAANAARREAAEAWRSIARDVAARSRLRGAALEKEIRRALKGISCPSGRSIREAIRGTLKLRT